MLARYFHNLMHLQLNKRAVRSLEYAMIVMVVAVASVGAINITPQDAAATPAPMLLASAK